MLLCAAKVNELKKIKVGAVSYLNTKPYLWGLTHSAIAQEIELTIDYPARIAQGLTDGSLDIGLIPVAVLPELPSYHFVCDYGIACDGEVASVALFSEVPLGEIQTIQLDYQSRTSVALLRILLKKHWKIQPELQNTHPGEEPKIEGSRAALLIGDRALIQRSKSRYVYDLGLAWKEMTGLPFVFAAWVSREKLEDRFGHEFSAALELGVEKKNDLLDSYKNHFYDLRKYFSENIVFRIGVAEKKGLSSFLDLLKLIQ
jgi:chorismate dehydratase